MFSLDFCEIFENNVFTEHLRCSAFVHLKTHLEDYLYQRLSAMESYFNEISKRSFSQVFPERLLVEQLWVAISVYVKIQNKSFSFNWTIPHREFSVFSFFSSRIDSFQQNQQHFDDWSCLYLNFTTYFCRIKYFQYFLWPNQSSLWFRWFINIFCLYPFRLPVLYDNNLYCDGRLR